MKAKRGRPALGARSLDAALDAAEKGQSPTRPRNEFERQAMRKTKGRKPNPISRTRQAAQCAAYLIQAESISLAEAARQAGQAFQVHADNVRKYARAIVKGPQVTLRQRHAAWFGQLPPRVRPLLQSVTDE